jgi:hypothetical protein
MTAASPAAEPAHAFAPGDRELDPTSRVGRYVRRLDERLAQENLAGRLLLLNLQLGLWTRAYESFVRAINIDELDPPPDGPDVNDYLLVIAAIQTRLGRLQS